MLDSKRTVRDNAIRAARAANIAASLELFDSIFPTEEDCIEQIFQISLQIGELRCGFCDGQKLERRSGKRTVYCFECRKKTWITARTLLCRVRHIRVWSAVIWLLERGLSVTGYEIHRLFEVSTYTAQCMLKKLSFVIETKMDNILCPSAAFIEVFGRRSRQTPAQRPAYTEEEVAAVQLNESEPTEAFTLTDQVSEDEEVVWKEGKNGNQRQLSANETQVFSLFGEKPIHFDMVLGLSNLDYSEVTYVLVELEIAGLLIRLAGDYYIKAASLNKQDKKPNAAIFSGKTNQSIQSFIAYVCSTYQAISRKYLQCYLALYSCQKERTKWENGQLLKECLQRSKYVVPALTTYISPLQVRICHTYTNSNSEI